MQMPIKSYIGYFSATEILGFMLIFEIEFNEIFSACLWNFPLPYLLKMHVFTSQMTQNNFMHSCGIV